MPRCANSLVRPGPSSHSGAAQMVGLYVCIGDLSNQSALQTYDFLVVRTGGWPWFYGLLATFGHII